MVDALELMNMESMLYGNTPYYGSLTAPSVVNNYCSGTYNSMLCNPYMNSYLTPYMNGLGANNIAFGQNPGLYTTQNDTTSANSIFNGLSSSEQAALVNDYAKSLSPSESFLGAAAGAVGFSVLFHPRAIFHARKTYKAFDMTNKMFEGITQEGSELCKAWRDPKFNEAIREAYTATHRINARSLKKEGFHIWRNAFEAGDNCEEILKIMDKAVKNFKTDNPESIKELIEATEALNRANVKNGKLPQAWNWIKNKFRGTNTPLPKAYENALAKPAEDAGAGAISRLLTGGAAKETAETIANGGRTYLQTLKSSGGGIGGAIFMMGMEFLGSIGKIRDAFKQDSSTGWKQVGQTTVNGLGGAVGWAAGEALGTWGYAKLLAKYGNKVKPGIGAAIGAIAGMVVGSLGCWFTGKITHKIVGQDVADKVQAQNMLATTDGQVQLLQNTVQRMQKGENVDPQAQMAVQKILAQYS